MPENNEIDNDKAPTKNDKAPRAERGPRPDRGDVMDRDRDRDRDRDYDDKHHSRGKPRSFFRKKVCKFCTGKYKMDYKDAQVLRRFTSDRGKILPRRITGTCAKHQRQLSRTIKRARVLALLPFVSR
jgi:small subunit ribosomal protein S18